MKKVRVGSMIDNYVEVGGSGTIRAVQPSDPAVKTY